MDINFQGKTLIVTGAASGLGLLTAQCFCNMGGNSVLADVNEEALNEKVKEITDKGGKAIGVVCDVRDYNQVCNVRDKAVEVFGSIDVMVNCAGGSARRILNVPGNLHFADVPIEVFDWGIDVNLKGQFYFDHAVMKQMREQNSGVIINIGSITGEEGCGGAVDYSTAKSGAMYGLTKSLALAGASRNIRCVCVSPGPVLTREAMSGMKTLAGRAAEPQEIVDLILYLASDKAAFINGVNILADGGRNIMRDKVHGGC